MAAPSDSRRTGVDRRNLLQATGLTAAAAALGAGAARPAAAEGPSNSVAMRRLRAVAPTKGSPALPGVGVIAFNRMAFGPRPGDLAAFGALGATNSERLAAFVAQQLDPDSLDDSELDARMAQAGFESLGLSSNPDTYLATPISQRTNASMSSPRKPSIDWCARTNVSCTISSTSRRSPALA